MIKYMRELKAKVGQAKFEEIVKMAEDDIKFNRVGFGVITGPKEFITICNSCCFLLTKCEVIQA